MSHNKHWTKQKLAEARATWVRPNDEKTVVTVCTGSRCRKPLLPTAEQLERMQVYSLTIKQESDVRAEAAQLPGGFITADDVLEPEPWSDSLTANPGQRLTVPDSLTALTALSLTV